MNITNKKIELTQEESDKFKYQFKRGIICQLHKEKLLTSEQLKQVLKSIKK